jgi:hypothetical protein
MAPALPKRKAGAVTTARPRKERVTVQPPIDVQFVVFGVFYVAFKWTVGIWALRRVKASIANHWA